MMLGAGFLVAGRALHEAQWRGGGQPPYRRWFRRPSDRPPRPLSPLYAPGPPIPGKGNGDLRVVCPNCQSLGQLVGDRRPASPPALVSIRDLNGSSNCAARHTAHFSMDQCARRGSGGDRSRQRKRSEGRRGRTMSAILLLPHAAERTMTRYATHGYAPFPSPPPRGSNAERVSR